MLRLELLSVGLLMSRAVVDRTLAAHTWTSHFAIVGSAFRAPADSPAEPNRRRDRLATALRARIFDANVRPPEVAEAAKTDSKRLETALAELTVRLAKVEHRRIDESRTVNAEFAGVTSMINAPILNAQAKLTRATILELLDELDDARRQRAPVAVERGLVHSKLCGSARSSHARSKVRAFRVPERNGIPSRASNKPASAGGPPRRRIRRFGDHRL
jgi:hypothetical protein